MPGKLVNLKELSNYISYSRFTIYRLVKEGKIKSYRIGRNHFFDLDEIFNAFKQSQEKTDFFDQSRLDFEDKPSITWEYSYKWSSFIQNNLLEINPATIFLKDRGGAELCEYTDVIPEKYLNRVFFTKAFDYFSKSEKQKFIQNKVVVMIDEIYQHGSGYYNFREELIKAGAKEVILLVAARRKNLVEKGEISAPEIKVCFDLEDQEFINFTIQLTNFFRSRPEPLDVDHIYLSLDEEKDFDNRIDLVNSLASFGLISFPSARNDLFELTIDEPNFLSTDSVLFPKDCIKNWSVWKIRIYCYKKRWNIVPVAFPHIAIDVDNFENKINKGNKLLLSFLRVIEKYKSDLQHEKKASILYECLHLYFGTLLFCEFIKEVITKTPIRFTIDQLNVRKRYLIRMYGKKIGEEWHDLIEKQISFVLRGEDIELGIISSTNKTIENDFNENFAIDDKEVNKICNIVLDYLRRESKNAGYSVFLSHEELIEKLGIDKKNLSQALDILLDFGLLKPKNNITPVEKSKKNIFDCLRAYALTEYGSWKADSCAYIEETFGLDRTKYLIPYIIRAAQNWKGLEDKGTEPTLINKLLTNIQHDWSYAKKPLFLRWKPRRWGPVPTIPLLSNSQNYFYDLDLFEFSKTYRTYLFDNNKKFFTNTSIDVVSGLKKVYDEVEILIIDNLLKIYKVLWSNDKNAATTLIEVSFCRDDILTYIHCYQEINIFYDGFYTFFEYLKDDKNKLNITSIDKHLEVITSTVAALNKKLAIYKDLPNIKQKIENILKKETEYNSLAEKFVNSLKVPIVFTDRSKYPLLNIERASGLIGHLSTFIQNGFSLNKLASDRRKTISKRDRELKWYKDRLMEKMRLFNVDIDSVENIYTSFTEQKINNDFLMNLKKVLDVTLPVFTDLNFLPEPPQNYPLEVRLDIRIEEVLKAYSSLLRALSNEKVLPQALGFIDLYGFQPMTCEILSYIEDKDIIDIRLMARETLKNAIEIKIEKLQIRIFKHPSGGDSWFLLAYDPLELLELSIEILQHYRENNIYFSLPIITLNWDTEKNEVKGYKPGGALGPESIASFKICDSKQLSTNGGHIYLTESFYNELPGINLKHDYIVLKQADFILKYPSKKTNLYEVNWKKYYDETKK